MLRKFHLYCDNENSCRTLMLSNWAKKPKIGLFLNLRVWFTFVTLFRQNFVFCELRFLGCKRLIDLVFYFFEPLNSKQNSKESKSKHRKIIQANT